MRSRFLSNLPFWFLHGIACSAPSFFWAIGGGFSTAQSILAMIVGVLTLILVYSTLSSSNILSIDPHRSQFARSVRIAAHLRAIFACAAFLVQISQMFAPRVDNVFGRWLGVLPMLDGYTGLIALQLTQRVLGAPGNTFLQSQSGNSFLHTYSTTLMTGLLFSILFFLIVLLVRIIIAVINTIWKGRTSLSLLLLS